MTALNVLFAGASLLAAYAGARQDRAVRPVSSDPNHPLQLGVYGALLIAIEDYPPSLGKLSTPREDVIERRYAPGFPRTLEPALAAEMEEVRRRAGR